MDEVILQPDSMLHDTSDILNPPLPNQKAYHSEQVVLLGSWSKIKEVEVML